MSPPPLFAWCLASILVGDVYSVSYRHSDNQPASAGQKAISDKLCASYHPHINAPYVPLYWENHWGQNYTVPISPASSVQVTDKFDSGFRVHDLVILDRQQGALIDINIIADPFNALEGRHFRGRFFFRVTSARNVPLSIRILNADYPEDWPPNYSVRATYDHELWFQVPTNYTFLDTTSVENTRGILQFQLKPTQDVVYFASWAVHTYEREALNVARWSKNPSVRVQTIGQSLDHRDIQLVTVGAPGIGRNIWVVTGQHPSERQGPWFVEGLVDRLVDSSDPTSRMLLQSSTWYIVPNLNPDGNYLGYHRTNRNGINLNRAWGPLTTSESPETAAVQVNITRFAFEKHMKATNPEYLGEKLGFLRPDPTLHGPTNFADAYAADTYHCVGATLELISKDLPFFPDAVSGFSPQRAKSWGARTLDAVLLTLPYIRRGVHSTSGGEVT
ncbi:Uncharacterized protein ZMO1242 [Coccomyxa sp. Obi]|nr:Uncharacterized protein ZMO1242 [Coccomyxa sp. Obi]